MVSETKANWAQDVAETDFERLVLQQSFQQPVVVDFWAPWCGPCRMLGPLLESLVAERKGEVVLAKINVDQAQSLAMEYGIESIPAVKAFRDGKVVLEFIGALPEARLREFIDRICPTEADRVAAEAARAETTDPATAEKSYRRALELDPNHQAALAGLARLLIARGEEQEATGLLDRIADSEAVERLRGLLTLRTLAREFGAEDKVRDRLSKDAGNAELHYQLGCLLGAAGKYPEALPELLAAAEADRKLAKEKVKEVMVRIFHIIGVRSDLADEYRDKLTRVLY